MSASHPTYALTRPEVDVEPVEVRGGTGPLQPLLVPVGHLEADDDAEDHDDELEPDGEPVLLADGRR